MSVEWRWIHTFAEQFKRCALQPNEIVAILSESQSRAELVETARLAAQSLGAQVFDVVVPTPHNVHPVPIRSTGASQAIAGNSAVISALKNAGLVVDCTVEGLLHAPELGQILDGGARVLMISNEHPDNFDRIRTWPVESTSAIDYSKVPSRCGSPTNQEATCESRSRAPPRRAQLVSPAAPVRSPTGPAVW
jgi:2,5-dihydroxypyridine 5,6-dioxygenase